MCNGGWIILITRTIYSNRERSDQFLKQNGFFNSFLRSNKLELKLGEKNGIRNLKEMLENENHFPHSMKVRTLLQKLFHHIMTYRSYKTQEVELFNVSGWVHLMKLKSRWNEVQIVVI